MIHSIFFKRKLLLVAFHVLVGFLVLIPGIPVIYTTSAILVGVLILVNTKNRDEEAFFLAAYIAGMEVFARMTKGVILYETGKYGVILLLLLGLILGPIKQKFTVSYIFYLFFLLLGIVFTQVPEGESIRKAIAFNLSGPFALGISAIYFYKRRVTKEQLMKAMFAMVLPVFSMVTYLYFKTPDLREILFTGQANFVTSGGFGPNQVATGIGIGIFVVVVFMILREKLTGFILLDTFFLIYFIYRGLLTFSRGGIISGAAAIFTFLLFYILYKKGSIKLFIRYFLVGGFFLTAVWLFTSDATGGMLDNRYAGKNASGIQKEDITSGRVEILDAQFKNFLQNPLGIGVGNGKYSRELTGEVGASHNEIGRMIEEHGLIGLFLLLLLLIQPLSVFWKSNNYQRAFLISFYLLWLLTINHSAMRIVFPGFIYGLCLMRIVDDDE